MTSRMKKLISISTIPALALLPVSGTVVADDTVTEDSKPDPQLCCNEAVHSTTGGYDLAWHGLP